jgi:hypothetical protein
MPFPEASRLELPILQELKATGGREQPRYLYERLVRYFPQLTPDDLNEKTEAGRCRWHLLVQRAVSQLVANGELKRHQSIWEITPRGLRRVEAEAMLITRAASAPEIKTPRTLTHREAQQMLVEIGQMLGRHAETEFEHYDVVWRESARAPRLSHVFEVQIAGSVDSALTRLKHAYDTQRSRPFLVIADERDTRFAGKRMSGSFHEIQPYVTVIGVGELQRLYESLRAHETLIAKLVAE